jgi:hypothetical protein
MEKREEEKSSCQNHIYIEEELHGIGQVTQQYIVGSAANKAHRGE